MSFDCTDCKIFLKCQKNSDYWEKAKRQYPNNPVQQVAYMNLIAMHCDPKLVEAQLGD